MYARVCVYIYNHILMCIYIYIYIFLGSDPSATRAVRALQPAWLFFTGP